MNPPAYSIRMRSARESRGRAHPLSSWYFRPRMQSTDAADPRAIDRAAREQLLRRRGGVIWLTGLSGAGKSTIADALQQRLREEGHLVYVLDGDTLRRGLNADLGFSAADRRENIRRVGEVAALFADAGFLTITALISPFRADRERARDAIGAERFLEVFVDVPLEVCEQRDPKGLYRRARAGELPEFTGISSPYEPPLAPALTLGPAMTVDACVAAIAEELVRRAWIGSA